MAVSAQVQGAVAELVAEVGNLDQVQARLEQLSTKVAENATANAAQVSQAVQQVRTDLNGKLGVIFGLLDQIEAAT